LASLVFEPDTLGFVPYVNKKCCYGHNIAFCMLLATSLTASSCQNVETALKDLLKEESSDVYEEDKKHRAP
jgi:hypothetical protein